MVRESQRYILWIIGRRGHNLQGKQQANHQHDGGREWGEVRSCALPRLQPPGELAEDEVAAAGGGQGDGVRGSPAVIDAVRAEAVDDRLAGFQAVGDSVTPQVNRHLGQGGCRDLSKARRVLTVLQKELTGRGCHMQHSKPHIHLLPASRVCAQVGPSEPAWRPWIRRDGNWSPFTGMFANLGDLLSEVSTAVVQHDPPWVHEQHNRLPQIAFVHP